MPPDVDQWPPGVTCFPAKVDPSKIRQNKGKQNANPVKKTVEAGKIQ